MTTKQEKAWASVEYWQYQATTATSSRGIEYARMMERKAWERFNKLA